MKNIKNILLIIFAIILMSLAWYTGYKYNLVNTKQETSVRVVLDKIEKVFKLVTVEGHLSEIYDYKEYHKWELSMFRKKALLRVNAKVLAGFDFEKVKITADEESKTIYIDDFPEAEILSMEHDIDYYDITQGSFNKFSAEDYNRMNKEAKNHIRKKALDSKLLVSAEAQKDEILDMLKTLIQATGWVVVIENKRELISG